MFPEELPRRLIKMFSFVGDTVLDPFLGSGTTALAAKELNRNAIGYEINEDFLGMMSEKLGLKQKNLFDATEIEIIKQEKAILNYGKKIGELPYIFKDPIRFDKKVDPRKARYESKIDKPDSRPEIQYYTVKEILSPEILVLDDGSRIRLLGVKENPEKNTEAVEFLREKTRRQKVFLRFDTARHDKNQNLFCYLYLRNKTFINAHLIKRGLTDVDSTRDYRCRSRFLKYSEQRVSGE